VARRINSAPVCVARARARARFVNSRYFRCIAISGEEILSSCRSVSNETPHLSLMSRSVSNEPSACDSSIVIRRLARSRRCIRTKREARIQIASRFSCGSWEEARINLRFAKRERPEEARWRCGKRDSIRSLERPDEKLTEIRVDRVRLIATMHMHARVRPWHNHWPFRRAVSGYVFAR